MNRFHVQGSLLGVIPALTTLLLLPAAAQTTLVINGQVASRDVRTLGGSAYVKISDVAKALGLVVIKRPGGYELVKPGGANQVQGVVQGKVGDTLFDGRWRFRVISVAMPDSYTMKTPGVEPSSYPADTIDYNRTTQVVRAKPGYKLIVVQCRMANGQKTTQTFWLRPVTGRSINTALADTEGGAHTPVGFDLEGAPIQSAPLLPGAKLDFSLLFSVPEATELKDLVFTLTNNDDQGTNDVRVSLTSK